MKRSLIITIGIVIILLVLGVWVYLMLFGAPKDGDEVFANFGFDFAPRTDSQIVNEVLPSEPEYTVDVSGEGLSQLTTRAVAGFVSTTTNNIPHVRYAEVGTGHIYDINLATGEEKLLSRTTIPRVQKAHFSPKANVVALESFNGYTGETFFGTIDEEKSSITGINLPPNSNNLTVTAGNKAQFIRSQNDIAVAYSSDLSGDLTELFRIPFQSVVMRWEGSGGYLYNRPDPSLTGYLYKIVVGGYDVTKLSGYGLVADNLDGYIGFSFYQENELITGFLDPTTDKFLQGSVAIIPEKCAALVNNNEVVCAAPINSDISINDWYKGTVSINDYLWKIEPSTGVSSLLINLAQVSGRDIDVNMMASDLDDTSLLFTNKIDGSLWRYAL